MHNAVACRGEGLLFFDSAEELSRHDMLGWGDEVNVHGLESSVPVNKRRQPKTLLCHDMKGGYLPYDRLEASVLNPTCHPYTLMHWWYVDVFVYFSHHFVTVPPLTWIQQSHRHGVPALGTFITEFDDGTKMCRELFATAAHAEELAIRLAEICKRYHFEGWLLNIENAIDVQKESLPHLASFVRKLTKELKAQVGAHSLVVWYDSVTRNGELKWQNELNELNYPWFDMVDAVFVNYTWEEENLASSMRNAWGRCTDVYIGVDVFGRGCLGDGGWNCRLPIELIRKYGLGVALFAPGWISETCADKCVFESSAKFWGELRGLVYPHSLTNAHVHTNFNVGFSGDAETPTFCAADAQLQAHLLESAEGQLEASRGGLLFRECMDYVTLFLCDIPIGEPAVIRLKSTSPVMIRVCVLDDAGLATCVTGCGELEIAPAGEQLRIKAIQLKKCLPASDEPIAITSFSLTAQSIDRDKA